MINDAIIEYIKKSNIFGDRAYYQGARSNSAYPLVVVHFDSQHDNHPRGIKPHSTSEFELNVHGNSPGNASIKAKQLKSLLNNFKGDMEGYCVSLARIVNEYTYSEPQSASYVHNLTLIINYERG